MALTVTKLRDRPRSKGDQGGAQGQDADVRLGRTAWLGLCGVSKLPHLWNDHPICSHL